MPRSLRLASHTASSLSVLGRPGRCSGVVGVDQPHHQPPRLQQGDERPPIIRRGLHHDPLDPLADQLLGQLQDLVGGRGDLPHRGDALARLGGMRHAGTDHPRRLGDIDRGDPAHDLLVLVDLDLLACWHRAPPWSHRDGSRAARGSVGDRNADRRARGNSARPCCRAPAPDSGTASSGQGHIGVGGQPDPFPRQHGVPQGDTSTQVKIPARGGKLPGTYTMVDADLPSSAKQSTTQRPCRAAHLHPSGVAAGHKPLTMDRQPSAVLSHVC